MHTALGLDPGPRKPVVFSESYSTHMAQLGARPLDREPLRRKPVPVPKDNSAQQGLLAIQGAARSKGVNVCGSGLL